MQVRRKLAAVASIAAAPLIGGAAGVAVGALPIPGPPASAVAVAPPMPATVDPSLRPELFTREL